MENQESKLSVGKQAYLKYFKWIWGSVAILIVGIGYWLYSKGKKDANANKPDAVDYPPDFQMETDTQKSVFDQFAKTDGLRLANAFGDFFSIWRVWFAPLSQLVIETQKLSDKQVIYINNLYNAKFWKIGKGSLVKDIEAVVFQIGGYKDFTKRLRKLGAK